MYQKKHRVTFDIKVSVLRLNLDREKGFYNFWSQLARWK